MAQKAAMDGQTANLQRMYTTRHEAEPLAIMTTVAKPLRAWLEDPAAIWCNFLRGRRGAQQRARC